MKFNLPIASNGSWTFYCGQLTQRFDEVSYFGLADNLTHSKETITAYRDTLITLLNYLPCGVKLVCVCSDGPVSQFKNRFIEAPIATFQKKENIQVELRGQWIVSGDGGSVKHWYVEGVNMKVHHHKCSSFVHACEDMFHVQKLQI